MSTLRTYIGSDASRIDQFARLKQGKSTKEVRELEMEFLRPEKLQIRIGAKIQAKTTLEMRSVLLVFPTEKSVGLFKKYFKVSEYKGQSAHKIDMLIDFLQAIDNGELVYVTDKCTFTTT